MRQAPPSASRSDKLEVCATKTGIRTEGSGEGESTQGAMINDCSKIQTKAKERERRMERERCDEASDLQLGELEVLEELPGERGQRVLGQVSGRRIREKEL